MATLEQERESRSELQKILGSLVEVQPESLVRADVLGKELSFEPGLPVFRRTLDLFKTLLGSNLENVSFETLQQLNALARQAFAQFQAVKNFSSNQANPMQVRDSLIGQIRDQWHSYYAAITPVIAYSAQRGTDFDRLEREARGTLTELQQIGTEMRKEKDKNLAEMNAALEQVRRAAAEAGVAQHAVHFKEEAEAHQKQSALWLFAAVAFAVVTIIYAFFSLEIQLHDAAMSLPTGRLISLALARVVIISIFTYGMVFSARNYGASRHNFVINRHRQNALSTFETFVKAARDPQTKDEVLVQATQSIFAPQTSGYLRVEGEAPQNAQIVEIVRRLTGTKD